MKIAWYGKHYGEEPPITGDETQGAGTIFFSGCNLHCVFCQNYQISQQNVGYNVSAEQLAEVLIDLQNKNAATLDLVTPTIWWREIKQAIIVAKENGLTLPIVWNSNGYESVEIIRAMNGLIDVYLPDFKYGDDAVAEKYSGIKNYPTVAIEAMKAMIAQTGELKLDDRGVATGGVIIRHLILPNNAANSIRALELIAENFQGVPVSLMRQYYPLHVAEKFPELNREVSDPEFQIVFDKLIELGLDNGWVQESDSAPVFIPDFTKTDPFKN
jgi:putative pyruvate formate lyase activating enzyme